MNVLIVLFLIIGIYCILRLTSTLKTSLKQIDSTIFRITWRQDENTKDLMRGINRLRETIENNQNPYYISDIADSLRNCEKIEYVANIENLKNDNFVSKADLQDSMQFLMRYVDFYTKIAEMKK